MPNPLDVALTLRLAIVVWWREFAPITFLGVGFLVVPSVVIRVLVGGDTPGFELDALVRIALSIGAMLFFSAVNFGVLSAFVGRRLEWRRFIALGLAASRPGFVVALVLSAAAVMLLIASLIGRGVGLGLLDIALAALALWGLATLLPAVPAAIAERLDWSQALARAAGLTRGNRGRLIALALVVVLALLPLGGVLGLVVYGPGASAAEIARRSAEMGLAHPGFWIAQLSNLLIAGALSTIPPAVYMQLVARR